MANWQPNPFGEGPHEAAQRYLGIGPQNTLGPRFMPMAADQGDRFRWLVAVHIHDAGNPSNAHWVTLEVTNEQNLPKNVILAIAEQQGFPNRYPGGTVRNSFGDWIVDEGDSEITYVAKAF